jgi:geranylgeranyl pyrophosphate synthase
MRNEEEGTYRYACVCSGSQQLKQAEDICMVMGQYFQIQDDVLDCYGTVEVCVCMCVSSCTHAHIRTRARTHTQTHTHTHTERERERERNKQTRRRGPGSE